MPVAQHRVLRVAVASLMTAAFAWGLPWSPHAAAAPIPSTSTGDDGGSRLGRCRFLVCCPEVT